MAKKSPPSSDSSTFCELWPRAKDPSRGKLGGYRVASIKAVNLGKNQIAQIWTCYLGFSIGGVALSRTRCWFVGEIITTRTHDARNGLDLLSIGAQNRADAIALRAVDENGKLIPKRKLRITFTNFVRKQDGTVKLTEDGKHAIISRPQNPQRLDPKDGNLSAWCKKGFVVIKPAGEFICGAHDFCYKVTTDLEKFTLQAFFLKVEHLPRRGGVAPQVEDGGTPPGDPSDLT